MAGSLEENKPKIESLILPVKFQSLKDNAEKIRFSYALLKDKGLLPNEKTVLPRKDNRKSLEARNQGNFYFKEKDYVEALKYYNKSLCFAPIGSENLALAYANRSAVYLNTGFYKYCLDNIEFALKGNYPSKMTVKLEQRKKECIEKMKKGVDTNMSLIKEKSEIKLSHKANPKVPCMIDGLEYATSIKYGRYVISNQDLYPGDVIIIEKPFVKSLISLDLIEGSEYKRCTNCLKSEFFNIFPCELCTRAMFCSEVCREEAFADFHKYECQIFGANVDYLMVRAALMTVTTFQGVDKIRDLLNDSLNVFESGYDGSRKDDQLKVLRSNAMYVPVVTVEEAFQMCNTCALIWHLLSSSDLKGLLSSTELEDLFLSLLYDYGTVSAFYSHSLSTMAKTPEHNQKIDGQYSPQKYGTGLLPISSLMNHSCAPNVTRMGNDNSVIIVVRRHIKPGEQIFDSYGPHHLNQKLVPRQIQIKKKYSFDCTCEACVKDYHLLDDLEMEEDLEMEFFPLCAGIMKILEYDKTWADKAFPLSKKFLKKFGDLYPAYEICAAQIIMIHCINILMIKTPVELQFKSIK